MEAGDILSGEVQLVSTSFPEDIISTRFGSAAVAPAVGKAVDDAAGRVRLSRIVDDVQHGRNGNFVECARGGKYLAQEDKVCKVLAWNVVDVTPAEE